MNVLQDTLGTQNRYLTLDQRNASMSIPPEVSLAQVSAFKEVNHLDYLIYNYCLEKLLASVE